MNSRLMIIAASLLGALLALPAAAQSAPAPAAGENAISGTQSAPRLQTRGQRPHHGQRQMDCQKTANPGACDARREARAKAWEACKDKAGTERRDCMREQHQNFDCSKSANPQQCEAHKAAAKACQGQSGPAARQCMQEKMPPVDCSKSANPQRCEQHQKAREACKDKLGPDHKSCLREQFKVK